MKTEPDVLGRHVQAQKESVGLSEVDDQHHLAQQCTEVPVQHAHLGVDARVEEGIEQAVLVPSKKKTTQVHASKYLEAILREWDPVDKGAQLHLVCWLKRLELLGRELTGRSSGHGGDSKGYQRGKKELRDSCISEIFIARK